MKVKNSYSRTDDRKYIGVTLGVLGVVAGSSSLMVAWPALVAISSKLI
jgi:hypothetical protein